MNIGVGTYPRRRATVRPEAVAFEFEGTTHTYGEVADRVDRLAQALRERGLRPGDRVAYLGFNHPALLETFFAANLAGATAVLVNPRLAPAEAEFIVDDSGAAFLVYGADQEASVRRIAAGEKAPHLLSVEGTGGPGEEYEAVLASASGEPVDADVADDDVALIMYTSGTTGHPKGAMLTHRNLTFQYLNAFTGTDLRQDEVMLSVAPLFHIAGLNMTTIPTFMMGGRIIIHRAFRPQAVLDEIARSQVTGAFMVPAMLDLLAQHPGFDEADLSSLRSVMVGGSPLPERSIRLWQDRGVKIVQGFGMTETAPGVCLLEASDALSHAGTAGRPHFFSEVRVVDPVTGDDVPDGTAGEVWACGPQVMKGYWGRDDATAAALEGGWYRTGDIAVRDADGYFTIKDRIKDMYISGGENVYPAEVENALLALKGVAEAAVIGVPDDRWGESGRAYVVLDAGTHTDADTLRAELVERLAKYKVPRDVCLVDELPRTSTGKIRKNVLREATGA
ncbi:long-chain fatty acid--CoA ligase [Micrococcus lylae]|uniref:acyl-CoA synthetase n=1 Tax=Micrococcus lylae TaxID=1273 RepID=UPI0021A7C600|nr:long-chain fatty acid--CoA ligase [Micrococcus lylae]MCT2006386.1 long-chain fatty acid--CoA ligase [Micrococcus lylae]MCT2071902.1 long-chain fatty acid--CoA ligase [Micrococcus lylae]